MAAANRLDPVKLLHALLAAGGVLLLTVAMEELHANSAVAGMVYLVLVVWTATRIGQRLSLAIALASAAVYDFFFLPPYYTFQLAGGAAWVAMACFLAASVVTGRVAGLARRQSLRAEQRRGDVERLYTLSQELMFFEDPAGLVSVLPQLLDKIFLLDASILYVHEGNRIFATAAESPAGMKATLAALPEGPIDAIEILGGYSAMPLMMGLRKVGALAWRPNRLSLEVATAVAAQASIALARALAIERSSRLEAARASERLRTALIDSLTHELRTPLTAIRAAATTLQQGEGLDEETRLDLAAVIDEEASHLDALIGEAVEMAQYDANTVKVKLASVNPHALLEQAVEHSRQALASHCVAIAPPQESERVERAWLDPQLVERVLHHLLENAARYTPPGSRIGLGSRCEKDRLEFRVEDEGPGIGSEEIPFIFDKFYRGKHGTAVRKGSGMGLAIVRAILTAHGGGIEVTSAPGQGAAFRFWIPLIEKEPENQAD